jgi:fermentation-respiration switch protein FrsA (DUF1100 family)
MPTTTREDHAFDSHGSPCAAWLYRPPEAAPEARVPCIVMAHGFSGTRRDGLEPYAGRFAAEGFGVLLFDYRSFGDSGGEPRQVIDVRGQQEDYRAAVRTAARVPWVDPARIALFGSSFSGGHVVTVAAGDSQIAAVVSQAPFADGLVQLRTAPPLTAARMSFDALRDVAGAALGREPVLIPSVGPPGSYAVMTAPEADPGFHAIVGAGSRWQNAVAARVLLQIGSWRPVRDARRVEAPLLVCVCDHDETTPPGPAAQMALNAPRGELARYPIGHFDIYRGEAFERAFADQSAFLERALAARETAEPAAAAWR